MGFDSFCADRNTRSRPSVSVSQLKNVSLLLITHGGGEECGPIRGGRAANILPTTSLQNLKLRVYCSIIVLLQLLQLTSIKTTIFLGNMFTDGEKQQFALILAAKLHHTAKHEL